MEVNVVGENDETLMSRWSEYRGKPWFNHMSHYYVELETPPAA